MFKFALVCCVLIAYLAPSQSAVAMQRRNLPALQHEEIHDALGQYALRYVTAEGTVVSERGRLVPNQEGSGYVMLKEGETRFVGTDGKIYVTKYSAGRDGFQVTGDHLPVAPEAAAA